MSYWWLLPIVIGASLILTWGLRQYALAGSLMDVPNERSSHVIPTPRGGGGAIVLSFLAVLPFLASQNILSWESIAALLGSGGLVALIGFLDDHGHIAARWRLLGHFVGAVWALVWLGGLPALDIMGHSIRLGWLGHVLAAFYLVWMLNLYNFMDGIDGIAAVEAVSVCLGGAILFMIVGSITLAIVPLVLAAAVGGFLVWNFPPAKIFMGDAGSGFLGITLGVLSLQAASVAPEFFWSWVILLGVFIVDATWTLIRRLLRGEKVYEAHRSHAYQWASRMCGRHLPVTLGVAAINLLWLGPLAVCVGTGYLSGVVGVVIAYAPLLLLARTFRAGVSEKG